MKESGSSPMHTEKVLIVMNSFLNARGTFSYYQIAQQAAKICDTHKGRLELPAYYTKRISGCG